MTLYSMGGQAAQQIDGKWVNITTPAAKLLEPIIKAAEEIEQILLLFDCVKGSMMPDCEVGSDNANLLWLSFQEKTERLKAVTSNPSCGNLSPAQSIAVSALHECAQDFLAGFQRFIWEHEVIRFRRSLGVICQSKPSSNETSPHATDKIDDVSPTTGKTATTPHLTEEDVLIINYLRDHHPVLKSLVDIEAGVSVSRKTAGARVARLIEVEILHRPEGDRGGVGLTIQGQTLGTLPAVQ